MGRPLTALVIFFVSLNLFSGAIMTTGVDDMLGINADVGGDKAVDDATAAEADPGSGFGATLFDMFNQLAGQLSGFFHAIMPGLNMLHRLGVPAYITGDGETTAGILGPLFSIIIFVDLVSFLKGWGL